jgi:aminomethyltransferase
VTAAERSSPRRVPLDAVHRQLGGTMTMFAGWEMPVRYGSDLAEHHAVRRTAGLFDVSHMGQVEVHGPDALRVLDAALVSRMLDLDEGRARYSMLCDDEGEVIDDVIVTRLPDRVLVVVNAANTPLALAALQHAAVGRDASVDLLPGRMLLALQGPQAAEVLAAAGAPDTAALRPFRARRTTVCGVDVVVSRTGYTGEDGFELAGHAADAVTLWDGLLAAGGASGLLPCGLAARDTLRLEAGLPLHGHELGGGLGPFEAGFGRVVHLDVDRRFRGRAALEQRAAQGPAVRIVGLTAEGRRSPRAGDVLLVGERRVGTVTSGAPSPSLGLPIALAAVADADAAVGARLEAEVRGSRVPVTIVPLPFVRRRTVDVRPVPPGTDGPTDHPTEPR